MQLQVIGTGLGRTGTLSLKTALGLLGYPCYHMFDLLFDPQRKGDVDFWLEVAGDPARIDHDWNRVFADYRATVDFPSCAVWRPLIAAHPGAKVVFTHHPRGAKGWYASARATIYSGTGFDAGSAFGTKVNSMLDQLVWHGLMQDTMEDEARAIARYNSHFEEVRDPVPADRLLVYSVDQGWDPLCAFLELPVPAGGFPQVNDRQQMARITSRLQRMRQFAQQKETG
jgi:hypothetical protein